MASPATRPVLIIEEEGLHLLHQHILGAPIHALGRDPKCDIRLTSKFISRRHATLVKILGEDGSFHYRIVDGVPKGRASVNGIKVNGKRVLACDLCDQDVITFGPDVRAIFCITEQDGQSPLFENVMAPTVEYSEADIACYRREAKAELVNAPDRELSHAFSPRSASSTSPQPVSSSNLTA